MSTLVLQIPPRVRTLATGARAASTPGPDEFSFVVTDDGNHVVNVGKAAANLLPRADTVVATLDDHDVSWHRVLVPKAPAAKLRAALLGTMEEHLLDDPEGVHLALEPQHSAGQEAWVCAVDKAWLQSTLDQLQAASVAVDRVVPTSWPEDTPLGHFTEDPRVGVSSGSTSTLRLTWSDVHGVANVPLHGGLARSLLTQWNQTPARWSANPSVAAQAERWLGASVLVLRDEQRALQAMRSLWNLRQFDLAPSHRGTLALRDAWKRFLSPGWRTVRYGLAAALALNVVGLNLWAWQLRGQMSDKRDAMVQVLRESHPNVKAVLDAPAQMQRETDLLRTASGRLGETDLETVLGALAAAWPDGQAPLENLRYEGNKLTLSAVGWNEAQVAHLRSMLRSTGWQVENQGGALMVSRMRASAS